MKSSKLALMLLALPFQAMSIDLSGNIQSLFKKEENECKELMKECLTATQAMKDAELEKLNAQSNWNLISDNSPEHQNVRAASDKLTYATNRYEILLRALAQCKAITQ